jgi:hypothetical protein
VSADNWAICPQCKRRDERQKEARRLEVQGAYGTMPQDEWLKALQGSLQMPPLEQTLREDYDIGIGKDGQFNVDYGASCNIGERD